MASAFDTTLTNLGINRSTSSTAAAATAKSSSSLGTSDFLKLLTAQLQNQDPFSPTDNSQMVAQLAQITSTSGIADMGATLKAIQTKLGGVSRASANGTSAVTARSALELTAPPTALLTATE